MIAVNITGHHQWDVPILPSLPTFIRVSLPEWRSEIVPNEASNQKMVIVIDMLSGPSTFCAKLSLFLLYYRLFAPHQWIRYLVYLGIGSSAATYTASTIMYGYLCLPRHGQSWTEAVLSSRCHKQTIILGYVQGPFNILSDLYLLFLPLSSVWQLHLPLRKRLGIAVIFLSGSL